jgi:uncharacterized protein YcbK (DUF882 family)
MAYSSDEQLFPISREPRSFWERTGLSAGQQKMLDISLVLLFCAFTAGWIYTAIDAVRRGEAPGIARQIGSGGSPLAAGGPVDATFAINALVEQLVDWEELRGVSGELQVLFQNEGDTLALPAALPQGVDVSFTTGRDTVASATATRPPPQPGVWNVLLRMRDAVRQVPNLNIVTLVSSGSIQNGRIDDYRIGSWPAGEGAYAPPRGFVQVTQENMNTYVSTHFQLKDFLTKGQEGVWPKYVALSPRLLDKLELTLQELERRGHPVENVFVVSGFRTPIYNSSGGNTQGRGALSRHMYGDASDIAIDNDNDGCMDDLTGDGRATVADARVIVEAAEQVERDYPHLIGGIGIYAPVPGSHCGMVHIDTRGNRARW